MMFNTHSRAYERKSQPNEHDRRWLGTSAHAQGQAFLLAPSPHTGVSASLYELATTLIDWTSLSFQTYRIYI